MGYILCAAIAAVLLVLSLLPDSKTTESSAAIETKVADLSEGCVLNKIVLKGKGYWSIDTEILEVRCPLKESTTATTTKNKKMVSSVKVTP